MKVLHLIGGGDVGGAKTHVLSLVKELSSYIDVKLVSLRPGSFAEDARAMGIDVEVVKTGFFLRDVKKVVNIIKNGNYQIVHSHGAKANVISALAKLFVDFESVTTVHSDYKLDYLHSIFKRMTFGVANTIALRFIDNYVAVSRNFKQMLIQRKFMPEKIYIVYNGIDLNKKVDKLTRQQMAEKYKIPVGDNDILVGIMARLNPVKDIGTLIDAANIVLRTHPEVKFLLCGSDDGDEKHLKEKVKTLGLENNILFLGHVSKPYDILQNLDINVLTSLSESFPYAILEGALLKKATISSNVGGISDLISNGKNGFLFEPRDYETLARHMLKLIENKSLREEFGEKIYAKVEAEFSLDNMRKTQLSIYQKIMDEACRKDLRKCRYDVIISGYYGYKNSGDDAILMAIIKSLRNIRPDIRILVLSANPHETRATYGVSCINRFNMFRIFNAMRKAKLFIYGGGNLLQDDTSTRSLMYYLSTTWMAKKAGLKMMYYASGIGPIKRNSNRKLTRRIVNKVDVITLREELSKQELEILSIDKPKILVAADPALTIEPEDSSVIDDVFKEEGINEDGPFVGFAVRKWSNRKKYIEIIAKAADYIYEKYNLIPVFIPMQYPDDIDIINKITGKMKAKSYIIKNKYNVSTVFGIISRMEIMVGMRLHALIYAASLGVPVVGLSYEPKVEAFLNMVNLTESNTGDINELEYDKLREKFDYIWDKRDSIRQRLNDTMPVLKKKAFESAEIAVELIKEVDSYYA